ncbi:phage portal protein [Bradyrhizobium sp. SZCCHNR3118]|uniref:phage portal protein n=1 Tax=Bradyrhizobium sp. SZCCHNR3118 TaxID=3057468 RepID=UPI002915CECA|nr:phage portal protein [Bradyrhizobium sp. SZCCHNR3118]
MANLLDRAIGYVFPRVAARRAQARAQIDATERATALYDGAARSFRTHGRRIHSTSANAETMMSLGRLRDVSRDLRRNNALAHNAIEIIGSHVVGAGIIPTLETTNKRLKEKLQPLIRDHLESPAIDVEGRNDIYGLQRLVMDAVAESGECIIQRVTPTSRRGLAVPLQVRILESDYLNSLVSGPTPDGGFVFEGIEFDRLGRRVAYHMFTEHPGGGVTWQLPNTVRVPAGEIIHVYRVDRPGQARGIPWCAPVIMTLWDLHDFEDAELVRQKIAACFAVFLEGAVPETNLAQRNSQVATPSGNVIERLEPGLIQKLPNGIKATMATPPIANGFRDYLKAKGHRIAAGFGVPYELLSTDNSDVSFISGRLGMIQFNKSVDHWRWHMLIPHACDGIGRWFLEAAAIELGIDLAGKVRLRHTPPRREIIEPSKEIPAMRDAIRSGLSSLQEELRTLGHDPEVILNEIAETGQMIDKLKIGLDSDGRRPVAFKSDNAEAKDNGKPGN